MVRAWRVLVVMTLVVLGLILSRSGAAAQAKPTLQVASELTTKNVRTEESNLAGLVADAIRAVQKSDIALIPAIGFTETTVPKGPATAEDVAGFVSGSVVLDHRVRLEDIRPDLVAPLDRLMFAANHGEFRLVFLTLSFHETRR